MTTLKREYSMSNADLCMLASNLVVFMTRDIAKFTQRGVTSAMITALQTLTTTFQAFPIDEYYVAAISGEVEAKNRARQNAILLVQLISGYLEQKWGISSYQYKQLGIKGITNSSDNDFLISCHNVVTVATEYLNELLTIGLTQKNIDELDSEINIFQTKLNSIASKKAIRDEKARERIQKGNELYSYCANYSKIGKLIWENVDEAKYNDYVIYKTSHTVLSKPQNLISTYIPGPPATVELKWDIVLNATNYDIYVSIVELNAPSGEFNLLDNTQSNIYNALPVSGKRNYYKIKAKNDTQTSDFSDETFIDL